MTITIGQLAKAAEVKIPTIRFYEQIGLLPEPGRTESDRRMFQPTAIGRLAFIKHARQLGFPIDAIRTLLDLADHPERDCKDADLLAKGQLIAIEAKIAQLEALRSELNRMVNASCQGAVGDCRVIEALSDHGLCEADHPSLSRSII